MSRYNSWIPIPTGCHFSLANIPFGIISTSTQVEPRVAIAIGEFALDLSVFGKRHGFDGLPCIQPHLSVFDGSSLNAFAALGRPIHREVRQYIQLVFSEQTPYPQYLRDDQNLRQDALVPVNDVRNHLPFIIGDYTDFFVGIHHAEKAAQVFNVTLARNYKHMPTGYAGRASSVVISGTNLHRPSGQLVEKEGDGPIFSPCKALDFELELACFVGKATDLGDSIPVNEASQHIFGFVLMNDWSARDLQSWEMAPLGPLNSKNFATTISSWVVLIDALDSFRVAAVENTETLLPYLNEQRRDNVFDVILEAELTTSSGSSKVVCRTNAKYMLFSFPQMLAHHTITGCPLKVGDLVASGTLSGQDRSSYASLLELTDNGSHSISMSDGSERMFLMDGDTVTFTGVCGDDEKSLVGFGNCTGTILPPRGL